MVGPVKEMTKKRPGIVLYLVNVQQKTLVTAVYTIDKKKDKNKIYVCGTTFLTVFKLKSLEEDLINPH